MLGFDPFMRVIGYFHVSCGEILGVDLHCGQVFCMLSIVTEFIRVKPKSALQARVYEKGCWT